METDRGGPRLLRAGVRADDPLPEIRHLQALVSQIALDILRHRPRKEQAARLLVAAQPLFELLSRRRTADPHVALIRWTQSIAQPGHDRVHRAPAGDVSRREAADLRLAPL